jgi:hypothetical protein
MGVSGGTPRNPLRSSITIRFIFPTFLAIDLL